MTKQLLLVISASLVLAGGALAQAKQDDCCKDMAAKATAKGKSKVKAAPMDCCMEEGAMAAQGEDDCCKDMGKTAKKGMDPCSDPNGLAKFKVYIVGKGYAYFGCEDMAKKGRDGLLKKGEFVGGVQKVAAKVKLSSGVKA